jgi:hypothetical protein
MLSGMTSFRRLRTIAVTVLMTAGFGVAVAPPASAATTCEYFADLPARVSIDRPEVRVAVPVRGCEGYMEYASADVFGPLGLNDILIWDGTRTDYWYLYDYDTPPGVYDTNDGGGWTLDQTDQAWRGDTSIVKFGTRAGVSATRSGSRVTINALATRYDGASNTFIPFANRVIAIDHCLTPTSSCSVLAYAITNAAGRASITVNAPALRSYQVRYGESSSFWGSTSTRVRA